MLARVPMIVVHGGAGREAPADVAPRRAGVRRAVDAGWAVLAAGGAPLDAVVAAVVVLEDDPHFNAGLGSVLTEDGTVETDASVMRGTDLAAGAVGACQGVANPVMLARVVLAEGREVMLTGDAVLTLARGHGLRTGPPDALVTAAARRRLAAREAAIGETVGAVACDGRGRVAAATSTGGLTGKRRGRIGDSAVVGAGTWADDAAGAASATGPGEAIIRAGVARTAVDLVARRTHPALAARHALAALERRTGALAGLVLVDGAGRVGIAHATPSMAAAYRSDRRRGPITVG
jgi:beta-aspartyl-peptidase (threonine type)